MSRRGLALVVGASLLTSAAGGADVPPELVLDVRVFEARSTAPSFSLFHNLSFFVDTDGTGVSETQWMGTLAGQIPETFLAGLASDTLSVSGEHARFDYELRSRGLELDFDLSEFLPRGTFAARVEGSFTRGGTELQALQREIELRTGQTYVFSSPDLELAPSEYLSHFREFEDRAEIYAYLRDYVVFLVVAVTPRLSTSPGGPPVPMEVSLPRGVELPELESPAGVELVGTLVLDFDVSDDGVPGTPVVRRSTVPELTPRVLVELRDWRFPEASGRRARLTLKLRAEP